MSRANEVFTVKCFSYANDMIEFINKNNIKKEDIQCITDSISAYTLFYWKEA